MEGRVHDAVRVKLFLDALQHRHGRAVEVLHVAAELEADAVVLVDDAAVRDRRADRLVPDRVVERRSLALVRRNLVPWEDEARVDNSPADAGTAGDTCLIPGSGRFTGGGNGNPLQYSCLEKPMVRGAWRAAVHGLAKSQT